MELGAAEQEGQCFHVFTCFPLRRGFTYMAAVSSLWSTPESDEVHSGVQEKAPGTT